MPDFSSYHRVLSRARWSARAAARVLLGVLVSAFAPEGPLVFALDDTVERRWGPKIKARGIYRDPVRSSRGHFVKASGLRWLCMSLLVPVPWAGRVWALPCLTVLCPSERYARTTGRRHKTPLDWARQAFKQLRRWLPDRALVVVGDTAYVALDWLASVRPYATVVARLRLDARLFAPAPLRRPGTRGRPPLVGARLPNPSEVLADPATCWARVRVAEWYGRAARELDAASGAAVWYHTGRPPVPVRWVLVRDPGGMLQPKAFLSTDPALDPVRVVAYFVRRWQTEVTFAEVRRHLGGETQRQWSDAAIARTTPCLLGLFSLVALAADRLHAGRALVPRSASWYRKPVPTFSDALAAVRRDLWRHRIFDTSDPPSDTAVIPRRLLERLTDALAYAA